MFVNEQCKKEAFKPFEKVSDRLWVAKINPDYSEEGFVMYNVWGWNHEPTISELKEWFCKEVIEKYDALSYKDGGKVNRILIKTKVGESEMTIPYWRNRNDRACLRGSVEAVKRTGGTTFKLEIDTETSLEVDVDKLLGYLDEWEVYAQNCYCVTAEHYRKVAALGDATAICEYDYTANYPESPTFEF